MGKDNALCMFVKVPRLGEVKTRLQPELSAEESLLLYKAMVRDLVHRFSDFALFLFYWPHNGGEEIRDWLGDSFHYFPQNGEDLGQRMLHAFFWAFAQGYRKVLIIGSDTPNLDASVLEDAFFHLDSTEVVIGPSTDGGYYLIGLKALHPELFSNITWSKDVVFNETLSKIRIEKLSVYQLPEKTDIDTFTDVVNLWRQLKGSQNRKEISALANTMSVLNQICSRREVGVQNETA